MLPDLEPDSDPAPASGLALALALTPPARVAYSGKRQMYLPVVIHPVAVFLSSGPQTKLGGQHTPSQQTSPKQVTPQTPQLSL